MFSCLNRYYRIVGSSLNQLDSLTINQMNKNETLENDTTVFCIDTTVLIIDDDPTILATLNKHLSTSYRVRAANSGERAIQMAATDPRPDLILLDVLMPGMNGYTVLSKLKQNHSTRDIPIIFVTSTR